METLPGTPVTPSPYDAGKSPGRFRFVEAFFAPQPALRPEILRILLPLSILGFLSSRLLHPGDWLTAAGFQVPDLGQRDWRQPLYLPPLPHWGAILLCAITLVSGLSVSAGFRTRIAAFVFSACLIYLALADRLAAFTVNKLGAVLMVALCFTPAGTGFGMDALLGRASKRSGDGKVSWGNVRFFQILLVTLYMASGIAKARGDWLHVDHVLWTHLHDSYQTASSYWIARVFPYPVWPVLQPIVLAFEIGAPLWFGLRLTRYPALCVGLAMHAFIGLAFGPVIWFALLMSALLIGCFGPLPGAWPRRGSGSGWRQIGLKTAAPNPHGMTRHRRDD
jgi:hypothetical protein